MKTPILILPGWKLSGALYDGLVSEFKKNGYKAFVLDLPGFGNVPVDVDSFTLDDYVGFVNAFMKSQKINKAILLGHSFGGRLAIKFAYSYPGKVEKLILTGVPIIRTMTLKKRIASLAAFLGKRVLAIFPEPFQDFFRKILYFSIGEWDYYKSEKLRNIFLRVINEDLVDYVKKLSIPILLAWGENDTITTVTDVEKIKKLRHGIESAIVSRGRHRLPIEDPETFVRICQTFL